MGDGHQPPVKFPGAPNQEEVAAVLRMVATAEGLKLSYDLAQKVRVGKMSSAYVMYLCMYTYVRTYVCMCVYIYIMFLCKNDTVTWLKKHSDCNNTDTI